MNSVVLRLYTTISWLSFCVFCSSGKVEEKIRMGQIDVLEKIQLSVLIDHDLYEFPRAKRLNNVSFDSVQVVQKVYA